MAIWKLFERAFGPSDETWKQIEQTPIPIGIGRIWLADKDGNVTRANVLDLARSETTRAG